MMGKHPEYDRSTFPFIRLGQINVDPVAKQSPSRRIIRMKELPLLTSTPLTTMNKMRKKKQHQKSP
jgi:hypothetical protein